CLWCLGQPSQVNGSLRCRMVPPNGLAGSGDPCNGEEGKNATDDKDDGRPRSCCGWCRGNCVSNLSHPPRPSLVHDWQKIGYVLRASDKFAHHPGTRLL